MELQRKNLRKGRKKNMGIILLIPAVILILYGIRFVVSNSPEFFLANKKETHLPPSIIIEEDLAGKRSIQKLLEGHSFLNLR
jgi:hypothetical protein